VLLLAAPAALHAQAPDIPDSVIAAARQRVERGPATAIVIGAVGPGGARYASFGRTSRDTAAPAADSTTVFEIGSITKTFTATLLAAMVAAGEITLDMPVERFLPDGMSALRDSTGAAVTLRHLATHRSALPRLPGNLFTLPGDLRNPYAHYGPEALHDFLRRFRLRRRVGERYEYSNLGVGLLGYALAQHAGAPYESLLTARVLAPLGLRETRINLTEDMRRRLAMPYAESGEARAWDFTDAFAGAGALRSTAADMVRWLEVQLGLRRSPLDSAIALTHAPQAAAQRPGSQVGLGWHRLTAGTVAIYFHDGGTGGYRSAMAFDPARRVGVVVLSNSGVEVVDLALWAVDFPFP
jgi:CubicO group peptidase (beta-lactamase class C family)